jgi:hypothetical protein
MHSSRSQTLHPVSDILRQVHGVDTNIQECIREWIKSAEFRVIDDLVAQVAFFQAENSKLTWETISILFQLPQSILYGWLRRREKEMEDDESFDLANNDPSGPNSFLTKGEEDAVLHHLRKYANLPGIFRKDGSMMEEPVDYPGGTVSKPGIRNSGRSLRMVLKTPGVKWKGETY